MHPRSARVLVLATLGLGALAIAQRMELRLPGDHRGFAPEQPIAFSHRLHAGELGIDCRYCHFGAWHGPLAGVPSAQLCFNCHREVSAPRDAVLAEKALAESEGRPPARIVSPEIRKLYDALGLDQELRQAGEPRPIAWQRVHDMPDFVHFDHSVHVARGLACQSCHGPVQSMERVRQDSSLSMGWCISCHRQSPARPTPPSGPHVTTDCVACHL